MKLNICKKRKERLSEQTEDNCWVFTGIAGALAPGTAEEKPGGRTGGEMEREF